MQYIEDLAKFEGQEVVLKGWVANKRESKGVVFIILRDGTGFAQCVASLEKLCEKSFEEAKKLTLESALSLQGMVLKDDRQVGGYEVQVTSLKIVQISEE